MTRHLLAAAACLPLLAPAAFAQASTQAGAFATQFNTQHGVGNVAANAGAITQTGLATADPGALPADRYDHVNGVLTDLFGPEPLVDNRVVVGTQLSIQNGVGNTASNTMATDQFGAPGGVGTAVAAGTQLNVQNGSGNLATNSGTFSQLGGSFASHPFGGLVNTQVAVGTQVNVQNGDGNAAANALGFGQVSQ